MGAYRGYLSAGGQGDSAKKALIVVLAVLMAGSPAFGAPEAEAWKTVRGKALHGLFADHELGDGVHYTYKFRADGSFAGTEMAKDVRGT